MELLQELPGRRERKLKWNKSNYRDLLHTKLPQQFRKSTTRKGTAKQSQRKLFSVEIIEKEQSRVKVHYIGFSNAFDEWKGESEVEVINGEEIPAVDDYSTYKQFSLYDELRIKIKRALSCNRSATPTIKIVMPFDLILFNGGLKAAAVPSRQTGGIQYYKITNYQDLNHLLGANWHFRGININGDYGYVVKETVEFYIRRSKPLNEYIYSCSDGAPIQSSINTGYSLAFCFICGYGNKDTFGKDKSIFV